MINSLGEDYSKKFWLKYFIWAWEDDLFYAILNDTSFYYKQVWCDCSRHLSATQSREAIVEFWTEWRDNLRLKFPIIESYFLNTGKLSTADNYIKALISEQNPTFRFIQDLESSLPFEKSIHTICHSVEYLTILLKDDYIIDWYTVEDTFHHQEHIKKIVLDLVKKIDPILYQTLITSTQQSHKFRYRKNSFFE